MYILDFLAKQKGNITNDNFVAFEYRLLSSGEIYNGEVETFDWRKSIASHYIMNSPFILIAVNDPFNHYPQELALRFVSEMVTEKRENSSYMFFPDEEIAKDLAAILSLFCRRLITVCSKVREIHHNQYKNEPEVVQDLPVGIINSLKISSWKHHPASVKYDLNGIIEIIDYNPQPHALSQKKLKQLFLALPNLPYAEDIIRSVRLYALALEQIYQDPDIAYQLLVFSIETMANKIYSSYTPKEIEKVNIKKNVSDLAVKFGLSKKQADQLAIEACNGIPWAKQKFCKFLIENTTDELWKKDDLFKLPDLILPKKQDFESAINEIYKERSKVSHSGGTYPATASIVTGPTIPANLFLYINSTPKLFPPVAWFERVVNNAINCFLDRAIVQMNNKT